MSMRELAAAFHVERLGRAPARHDPAQLAHWQREAVHAADTERLWGWMESPELAALVPASERASFVKTVQPNLEVPSDAFAWAERLYREPPPYTDDARAAIIGAGAEFFTHAAEVVARAHGFKEMIDLLAKATARKGKALYQPLRAALTGATDGPELAQVYLLLGERVPARIAAAQELAA
jgi:glutamyl-tRNA synthetase